MCDINDNVELVLCGTERTLPAYDTTPKATNQQCSAPWWEKSVKSNTRRQVCQGKVVAPSANRPLRMSRTLMEQRSATTSKLIPKATSLPPPPTTTYPVRTEVRPFNASEISLSPSMPFPSNASRPEEPCQCQFLHSILPGVPCDERYVRNYYELFFTTCRRQEPTYDCDGLKAEVEAKCGPPPASSVSHDHTHNSGTNRLQRTPPRTRQRQAACNELVKLFAHTFGGDVTCDRLAQELRDNYERVYIGRYIREEDSSADPNAMAELFSKEFPELKWFPTSGPRLSEREDPEATTKRT